MNSKGPVTCSVPNAAPTPTANNPSPTTPSLHHSRSPQPSTILLFLRAFPVLTVLRVNRCESVANFVFNNFSGFNTFYGSLVNPATLMYPMAPVNPTQSNQIKPAARSQKPHQSKPNQKTANTTKCN